MEKADDDKSRPTFRVTDRRGQAKEEAPAPKPEPVKTAPVEPKPREGRQGSIDFSTFILSMSTSALIHLGLAEDPVTRQKDENIPLARQEIDILEMLATKTKNNLTANEQQLMDEVLYELRVRFVQATKKL